MTLEGHCLKKQDCLLDSYYSCCLCMLTGCQEGPQEDNKAEKMMRLYVNGEELSVTWEDSESVEVLKEMVSKERKRMR